MSVWLKENNRDVTDKLILFLISPFLAFIYSLQRIKTKSSYIVFFLFSVFFGLSFTVDSGKSELLGIDGASYREKFEMYKFISSDEYYSGFKEYLLFDEGKRDYYFETIAFYVSRITDNYHVLFMVFAIIFIFFALKSFKFLTADENFNASIGSFILAYFFMTNQIFNINGVRFWTAAWITVYIIFQVIKNENRKYFLLALVLPFIHGSYWLFIGVLLIAFLFKRHEKFWIILFFISFFVSNISIDIVRNMIDSLPPFLARMANSYTNPEYIEMRNNQYGNNGVIKIFFIYLVSVYVNILVFLFIKDRNKIKLNQKTKNIYHFLIIWMTFINFTMPIPSLGGRFVVLSYPLIAYIWLVNFKDRKYQLFLYSLPFVFSYNICLFLFYYYSVLDIFFYVSSPFYLIYKYI